jgi:hypothetical protein
MTATDRFKLAGTYRTPRVRVGAVLRCEARGFDVVVTRYRAGPIRWPIGRRHGENRGGSGLIVFAGLAEAVRREAVQAVARAWGVTRQQVSEWRRGMGVGPSPAERSSRSNAARERVRTQGRLPKGRPWSPADDAAVRLLPPKEAARQTGRPVTSVYSRRHLLRKQAARGAHS